MKSWRNNMKQTLIFLIAIFSGFSYANPVMTDAEKLGGVKYLVNDGTLIAEFDYVSPEQLKVFEDYDFTVESAPCTVLGDYYSADDDNNTVYTVKVESKDFRFMCRSVVGMKETERRLYMIGSVYDCMSRPFDFSQSKVEDYKHFGAMCENSNRSQYIKTVDYSYLELFHPEKYFKIIAFNTK